MISEAEMYDWSPEPGDRIEVVFTDYTHARGILVAIENDRRFVYCDGGFGRDNWPATFRADQVRRERTLADHLMKVVHRLSTDVPRRRWFRDDRQKIQREVDYETARTIIGQLHSMNQPVNIADQIIVHTEDGLRRRDRVNIRVRRNGAESDHSGYFVAEFKGLRYVVYDTGAASAYPVEDVTPLGGVKT